MKIYGPNSTSSVSSSKRKGVSRTGGEQFAPETASQTSAAATTSAASAVQSVDAILALQSVGDFTEARKQATDRAFDLLDVLDELKIALLEGGLPRAKLQALMQLLQSRRDATNDAKLEAALDEVETRAAVELAKLS
ncbi:MAG: flagellar biosynthesis protein FlgI [Alphaproteobacteria bacterium]|nr:flagellar biosynthesis protein FlgI [Alphaproteobacteria bacterium]